MLPEDDLVLALAVEMPDSRLLIETARRVERPGRGKFIERGGLDDQHARRQCTQLLFERLDQRAADTATLQTGFDRDGKQIERPVGRPFRLAIGEAANAMVEYCEQPVKKGSAIALRKSDGNSPVWSSTATIAGRSSRTITRTDI